MQHLPVPAAHGDAVAGALERLHHPRCAEEGDGVVVLRSGLVVCQRVRLVHEHQVVLLGHHVRAHRLLVATAALGEGELVALELGLLRARGDVPRARGAVVRGGDDGVGVDELHLRDPVSVPGQRRLEFTRRRVPDFDGFVPAAAGNLFAV